MITRPIDDTGRVCIPMEYRRAMGVDKGGVLAMELCGNRLTVEKSQDCCCICGDNSELEALGKRKICKSCLGDLTQMAAPVSVAANGR